MNSHVIWAIIVCIVVVVAWIKLREMTKKAEFYADLSHLWEIIAEDRGGYAHPCVEQGMAYINSIMFDKRRRACARDEVFKLLDRSYDRYLWMLYRDVNRYLKRDASWGDRTDRDKSLHALFEANQTWLAFNEHCSWYGATHIEPPKKGKIPSKARKILTDAATDCGERWAKIRALEEEMLHLASLGSSWMTLRDWERHWVWIDEHPWVIFSD
ncbi:MAG: hypothetical protein NTY33_01125 [Candidatus Moranbacteria bacterium]|nr:hypothetical protein [Candidatus Moranbacteria bacterium]